MQQLPANGIVCIHCARRKFAFGFLEGDKHRVGLPLWRMEQANTGLPRCLEGRDTQSSLDVVVAVLCMKFEMARERQIYGRPADSRF